VGLTTPSHRQLSHRHYGREGEVPASYFSTVCNHQSSWFGPILEQ
jgi:hypothetical protein